MAPGCCMLHCYSLHCVNEIAVCSILLLFAGHSGVTVTLPPFASTIYSFCYCYVLVVNLLTKDSEKAEKTKKKALALTHRLGCSGARQNSLLTKAQSPGISSCSDRTCLSMGPNSGGGKRNKTKVPINLSPHNLFMRTSAHSTGNPSPRKVQQFLPQKQRQRAGGPRPR
jgi:hypothetical protein